MEQNFNTIDLEYIETKKVSLSVKILAFILTFFLLVTPLNEILNYNQEIWQGMCCLCPY